MVPDCAGDNGSSVSFSKVLAPVTEKRVFHVSVAC